MQLQQAFSWVPEAGEANSPSTFGVTSAVYASMLYNGQVTGVVKVDSTTAGTAFDEFDVQLLSVIANNIAAALKTGVSDSLARLPAVFISYVREEREFVRKLANDLRRRRIKVWYDERMQSGSSGATN